MPWCPSHGVAMGEYYPWVSINAIPMGNYFFSYVCACSGKVWFSGAKKPARGGLVKDVGPLGCHKVFGKRSVFSECQHLGGFRQNGNRTTELIVRGAFFHHNNPIAVAFG